MQRRFRLRSIDGAETRSWAEVDHVVNLWLVYLIGMGVLIFGFDMSF